MPPLKSVLPKVMHLAENTAKVPDVIKTLPPVTVTYPDLRDPYLAG